MVIEGVSFPAGRDCETTALGALLRHEGLDLSEPLLFGLGEGLGFVYWDAKNMDFPFLGGRTRPGTITRTAAHDLPSAAALVERGGTGGSLVRALYRDFLAECATITGDDDFGRGHRLYADIAPLWTEVSERIAVAGETGDPSHLVRASAILT